MSERSYTKTGSSELDFFAGDRAELRKTGKEFVMIVKMHMTIIIEPFE
jgi:hypothetical protein